MKKGQQLLKLILLFIAISFFIQPSVLAQKFNADSLFHRAHDKAIEGKYKQAITMADRLLKQYPEYEDARLIKARVYGWSKDYNAAINEVSILLREDEKHKDGNSALCDFYRWDEDYESAKKATLKALEFYPDDEHFLLKLLQIEFGAESYDEATEVGNKLIELYPLNEEAKDILRTIELREWKNEIRLEHFVDGYNQPFRRRWHMSSFGYGLNTKLGVYYLKTYFGDLIEKDELTGESETLFESGVSAQYSFEGYPRFDKYNYMFVNYAFSEDVFFPKTRMGLEYYHVFKKSAVEISLGYRYMNFTPIGAPDVNVNLFTGSLGKYIGSFWVSARPYIIDSQDKTFFRYSVSVRTFLKPEMSYLEWLVGTGTSPENPVFYISGPPSDGLDLWRVEMDWKQRIAKFLSLEMGVGFINTKYDYQKRRNQLIARSSLSFLF